MAKTIRYTIPMRRVEVSIVLTSYADRSTTTTDGRPKSRHDMARVLKQARQLDYDIQKEVLVCSVCSDPAAPSTCCCGRNLCALYSCRAICMGRRGHQ